VVSPDPEAVAMGYGDVASVYDGEYRHVSADVEHYLRSLGEERVRGPVLELGCGTGRLAIPIAQAGYRVTGVDLATSMLRRARRKRAKLVPEVAMRLRFSHQDMRRFHFPRQFSAAVIGFSTLNLLPEESDRRSCLQCTARHLESNAPLLLDLPNPSSGTGTGMAPLRRCSSFQLVHPWRRVVEKVVEQRPAPGRPVWQVRYEYTVRRQSDGAITDQMSAEFELARLERPEIESLLYETGFDAERVWGDYQMRPWSPTCDRILILARRLV
jgi:ubiquinone/menaquinone biosynthesis C-methylase UbiE